MEADVADHRLERSKRDVRDWRYDEARRSGLTPVESLMFAESDRELEELRKLVRSGCPTELVRQIVL